MRITRATIPDLAPDVFRQRLLIEGHYGGEMTEGRLRSYLVDLAAHLGLRAYGDVVVHAPASGDGRPENAGFDAFMPLIDSGICAYVWTAARFISAVIYTCKGFDETAALTFSTASLDMNGEIVAHAF